MHQIEHITVKLILNLHRIHESAVIKYWPFQCGSSAVGLLWFYLLLVLASISVISSAYVQIILSSVKIPELTPFGKQLLGIVPRHIFFFKFVSSNFKRLFPLIDVSFLFPLDICEKRKKVCIYILVY